MNHKTKKQFQRATGLALCLCILLSCLPISTFAVTADGLCEHHPEHTEGCGYVKDEQPCGYVCAECAAATEEPEKPAEEKPVPEETPQEEQLAVDVNQEPAPQNGATPASEEAKDSRGSVMYYRTGSFRSGDNVVIVCSAHSIALSGSFAGTAVTIYDDGTTFDPADAIVWKVVDNKDDTFSFLCNGQMLSLDDSGILTLGGSNNKWKKEAPADGYWHLRNAGLDSCYIKWDTSANSWTASDTITEESLFALQFYMCDSEEHTCTFDDGVVTTEPTCTKDGVKTFTCSGCGNTYTETIPAPGHLYNEDIDTCANCETPCVKGQLIDTPADGTPVFLYNLSVNKVLSSKTQSNGLNSVSVVDGTEYLRAYPETTIWTVEVVDAEAGTYRFKGDNGYLAVASSRLTVSDSTTNAVWKLTDGKYLVNTATGEFLQASGSGWSVSASCGETNVIKFFQTGLDSYCDHYWRKGGTLAATCTQDGYEKYTCDLCTTGKTVIFPATGHKDENNDYLCDICGEITCPHPSWTNGFCATCGLVYESAVLNGNVYEISNAGQLYWFAQQVNRGQTKINAVLTSDIDLAGINWTPIGLYTDDPASNANNASYAGTFDGLYHVIYNLNVNLSATNYEAGLFSRVVSGGALKNFGIINAAIAQTSDGHENKGVRAGVVAGEIFGGTVTNVFTAGNLTVSTKHEQSGGIAGECANSTLTSCYTTYGRLTTVVSVQSYVPTITNCYYMSSAADANSYGTSASADRFTSGEVTYRLNLENVEGVWKQTLGVDNYPKFYGSTVYFVNSQYTNTVPVATVEIAWGTMEFTYTDGSWNTENHTYDNGVWTASGNTVTVENTGNVAVTATVSYENAVGYDFVPAWDKTRAVLEAASLPVTFTLTLSGKPTAAIDHRKIGKVTVTLQ